MTHKILQILKQNKKVGVLALVIVCVLMTTVVFKNRVSHQGQLPNFAIPMPNLQMTPISHASMVLEWNHKTVYVDPVGEIAAYTKYPVPDLILVTDIHPDHFDLKTLSALSKNTTTLVVPQAVKDKLDPSVLGSAVILNNGNTTDILGITIEAIPMYNLPESPDSFHTKGRGNGYVLTQTSQRVYIAGDTANTPEVRSLKNIDVAFIPMNLPYTMSIESAAEAVLAFKPKHVYPYHYRGAAGFSDIEKFKKLVKEKNSNIDVVQLEWYPNKK